MRPEIKNYKAEADADLIPIPGQLEFHGSTDAEADTISEKIKIATISVRMVRLFLRVLETYPLKQG